MSNTTIGNNNGTYNIAAGTNSVVTVGNGNDTIDVSGGTDASITIGSGIDTIVVTWGTGNHLSVGGGNDPITVSGGSYNTITAGNGVDAINASSETGDTITVGGGNDTITAGAKSTISAGSGVDTITAGGGSIVSAGGGNDTINVGAGMGASVTLGNGVDKVTLTGGIATTINVGSGNDTITLSGGSGNTIIAGSGNSVITASTETNDKITTSEGTGAAVTVYAGASTTVVVGNGNDTISMGASDTVTAGKGIDTFIVGTAIAPSLSAPSQLTLNEEGSIALPITTSLSPMSFGHDTVNGFLVATDKIEFTTSQFSSFAAVMAAAKQVGANTVITLDATDSITLTGVSLSSLASRNFQFVSGTGSTGGTVEVTISGIPSGVSLVDSSGALAVTNGSVTLTTAQLAGLTLKAGEVTTATLTVTATNQTTGTSVSQAVALTVDPVAPTLKAPTSLSVNEDGTVALNISETPYDTQDTVSLTIAGVPADATLSAGTKNADGTWTLTPIQLSGLTLKAGNPTTTNLVVTATNTLGQTASTSDKIALTVTDTTTVTESVPTSLSGAENVAISLSGISVSASPNSSDILSTVLAVSHGTINVAASSGVTLANNGSGSVTLSGTAAAIDAALASTTYTGSSNYAGADTLSVTTSDANSGSTLTKTSTITLADTTAVAESVPATLSGAENVAISLAGISVSASPNSSDILSTVLAVSHGTISVGTPGSATLTNNGSGSVTLSGTAAAIDAALASTTYTGSSNYYGADTLSVTTSDAASGSTLTKTSAITLAGLSVALTDISGGTPADGQIMVASGTITGDAADLAAPITYQWQTSSNGGATWTNVTATTAGNYNNVLSSFYQFGTQDEGNIFRVQASFTDDTGQVVTATSAPTATVGDIAPIVTQPFGFALDEFKLVKGANTFDDTFTQGPPPVGGYFGSNLLAFNTNNGSIDPEVNGKVLLTAAGSTPNATLATTDSTGATLLSNTQPEGTGAGQSELGLKEDSTFTASSTFDLAAPGIATYGLELLNGTSSATNTQVVQLAVEGNGAGGALVALFETNLVTGVHTLLTSQTLTAAQLADNTQIELDLAHNTANNQTITASFELYDNGTETSTTTFATTATEFTSTTFVKAAVYASSPPSVGISGTAQEGQTLTAHAVTNDNNATLKYQWEESTSSAFTSFTDIGTNSATYVVQQSDENDYIRVVATATDSVSGQSATATSAATGPVIDDATLSVSTSLAGLAGSVTQVGQILVTSATITGDPSDLTAPVTYQWQTSNDGGSTWTNVPASTQGVFNNELSSFYQLPQADLGDLVRVQASFTDDTGQVVTADSTPTAAVAEVTPTLTAPFNVALDSFTITDGDGATMDDTFTQGPPPAAALFGGVPYAFDTAGGFWTEADGKAIASAANANGTGVILATYLTNMQPEGTGAGESESGLKEDQTFTVSATFDLTVPVSGGGLYNLGLGNNDDLASTESTFISVLASNNGGVVVIFGQSDPAAGTQQLLASQTLTAAQVADNTQIEFDLAHNTANTSAITGSFELYDNGSETFADTFSVTGHAFDNQTFTSANIAVGALPDVVLLTGTAQKGQTLTASTVTNDPDAVISYQWEKSTSSAFTSFTDIGTNSTTYVVQQSDENDYIRVVATATDINDAQSTTATSAATGPVIDDATLSVALTDISGGTPADGQIMVASGTITGDAADLAAPITYQWQTSSNGGATWTNVTATTAGNYNGVVSSFYQFGTQDEGNIFRVQASFTDDTGQVVTATSAPTAKIGDIAPIVTQPFGFALDEFKVVKGANTFDDTFTQGPPPVGGYFGSNLLAFNTNNGSIDPEVNGKVLLTAAGSTPNATLATTDSTGATLLSNTQPEGTGTGESELGLKEDSTFTASSTFDLAAPGIATYGLELLNGTSSATNTQVVQLAVGGNGAGGAIVVLDETNLVTGARNQLASVTLTAAQLQNNTQIELDLAHNTANSQTITASFELYDNGTETSTTTFATTATEFTSTTFVKAAVYASSPPSVGISGTAQEGQTLSAHAVTNDNNATLKYQWEESTSAAFTSFTDIGSNSTTYSEQASDIGDYIRVVATASDSVSGQSATATSQVTGPVLGVAPTLTAPTSLSVNEDGTVALGISETPFNANDPVSITIAGVPVGATLSAGTNNGNGTWSLTPTQLSGLTLSAGEAINTPLTVTATNTAGATASTVASIQLAVDAVAPTISISPSSLTVNEDGSVALPITITPFDPRDTVSVLIGGLPSGATLSDGEGDIFAGGGSPASMSLAQLDSGLTLTVGPQISATPIELTVQAANTGGLGANAPIQFLPITVEPVAPSATAPASLSVNEDGSIALGVAITPFDPSDNVQITIAGLPSDATLRDGNGDVFTGGGSFNLSLAQVDSGLTLTAGETTTAHLTVTATNEGGPAPAQQASASDTIALTVNPVAPTLTAPSSLSVNEDGTVALNIGETPFDARDIVSITISGVPSDASLSAGINNGNGTWTLTPLQLAGLTLTAGQATVTTLTVTATNTAGVTASASDTIALTVNPVLTVGVSVVDNLAVQAGQTLVTSATIAGDTADAGATITYQYQSSSNGGTTWTNVSGAVSGNYNNGVLSSFLQLGTQNEGQEFRVKASFTDSAGNLITATSTPTAAVADVTPEITIPFSYAVDDLSIVKNGTQIYNDTFSQAPISSPTILSNGVPTPIVFLTQGATWTEQNGQAVITSAGDAPNPVLAGSVKAFAMLNTNTDPTSTLGLKYGASFTVSSTFGLTVPSGSSYGTELTDGTPTHGVDQLVRLIVAPTSTGGAQVELIQANLTTNPTTSTVLASDTLTSAQLTSNNQIEFQFSHVANSTAITGTFELLENGTVDLTQTFTPTGTIFTNGVDWTRVDVGAFANEGVGLNVGAGQSPVEGQTLTAFAATNDNNVPITYQWEESRSASFTTFTDIGTNSATYTLQASDIGSYIRVVASTFDPNSPAGDQSATATSATTGSVIGFSISAPVTASGNEGSGTFDANLLQNVSDAIPGDVLQISNLVWTDNPGNGLPAGFTVDPSGTSISVDTDNPAYALLALGQTFTTHFSYDVIDAYGEQLTQTASITIVGTGQPVAPVLSVPSEVLTNENASLDLKTITISGGAGSSFTMNLSVGEGTLSLDSASGVTVTSNGANGTLTFSGSEANVEAALSNGVIFTPPNDLKGTETLTVTATASQSGQNASTSQTAAVDIAPVAMAPVLTVGDATPSAISNAFRTNTFLASAGDQFNENEGAPAVAALADGTFIVVWHAWDEASASSGYDIYGQRYAADGTPIGSQFQVNTATITGDQEYPAIAGLNNGDYVVAWYDEPSSKVDLQIFNSSGATIGSQLTVGGTTSFHQDIAALSNGGFVITYTEHDAGGGVNDGIFGQVYSASGAAVGSVFQVDAAITGQQQYSSVAALNGGGFVVTFMAPDASGDGIYAQIYNASGAKVGNAFAVNAFTTGEQGYASVTGLADGGFAVVWSSQDENDGNDGVYGRIYDASGNAITGDTLISSSPLDSTGVLPSITSDPDGGFIAMWAAPGDTAANDVWGQRVDANGDLVGSQFLVNQTTSGSQLADSAAPGRPIATLTDGNVVLAWDDFGTTRVDPYARIFDLPAIQVENQPITLPPITAALTNTDGGDSLTLVLSGFPTGSTFSEGAAGTGANAGSWVITDPTEIAALATTPLTMTPPQSYSGTFTLTVEAVVTDPAILSTGPVTSTTSATASTTITVDQAAPVLAGATSATVTEGSMVTLGATDMAAYSDDTLGTVTITGLPTDLTGFNGGTYAAASGTWTGSAAAFNALSFDAGGTSGTSTLSISATTTGTDAGAPSVENYTLTIDPASYSYTILSGPSGGQITYAFKINSSGQVAGFYLNASGERQGFIYSNGTYTTLSGPPGAQDSYADAINASDQAVGYFNYPSSPDLGLIYSNGTYTTLSVPGAQDTDATAINGSGQVVGYYFNGTTGEQEGFIYSGGTYTTLNPSGALQAYAEGINGSSEVAADYLNASGEQEGLIYSNGIYTTLSGPSGAQGTYAAAINDSGQVAGTYTNASGEDQGFIYSSETYTTLSGPSGAQNTFAEAINDSGQVAGYYVNASGEQEAFIYSNGIYTTLSGPSGARDIKATAINDSGQVAGYYVNASGEEQGFIATDPVTIAAGENFQINAPSADAVTFAANTGSLLLGASQNFTGTIAGFGSQDQIDLGDIAFSANTTLGYAANSANTGGTLSVSNGTGIANIALIGQYTAASFVTASDGHGGTTITDPALATTSLLAQPHA